MYKYFWFVSLCLLLGCKKEKQTENASLTSLIPAVSQTPLSETEIAGLYKYYNPDPQTTEEKDENALIDYMVSKHLKVNRTNSGLYYSITNKGSGPLLNASETLEVDYRGYFLNGKEFDSSYTRGHPIKFTIGQMIEGWNEGLTHLRHGDVAMFLIPSYLAYGSRGSHGLVPPDSPLIFELEVH